MTRSDNSTAVSTREEDHGVEKDPEKTTWMRIQMFCLNLTRLRALSQQYSFI